jgi:hypothetical protein
VGWFLERRAFFPLPLHTEHVPIRLLRAAAHSEASGVGGDHSTGARTIVMGVDHGVLLVLGSGHWLRSLGRGRVAEAGVGGVSERRREGCGLRETLM